MSNSYFAFKQFTIQQDRCAMKVTTDACLFGAWCATEIKQSDSNIKSVLDIGTGTGLLSLMVAQKNKLCIDAVELDKDAAAQASANIQASPFYAGIHAFHQDIHLMEKGQYDCIISNPPFYESDLTSPSPSRSAAHHDTTLRLTDLFKIIQEKLLPGGCFFLMLPYKRASQITALLHAHGLYLEKIITLSHSKHHDASRFFLKGSKDNKTTIEERWTIKEGEAYSTIFTSMLQDYYLYL